MCMVVLERSIKNSKEWFLQETRYGQLDYGEDEIECVWWFQNVPYRTLKEWFLEETHYGQVDVPTRESVVV